LLLPQRPYIPISTLRAAMTYPDSYGEAEIRDRPHIPISTLRAAVTYPDSYGEAEIRDALRAAKLNDFISELDIEDNWTQRLSAGEQQRLAIARAILARPSRTRPR
jgi:vitamin B12/bleomycin/antimicrobial peptide transport system ATP-binding/permease protein